MKVLHIVSGLERSDGGPSYSVPRLATGLKAAAIDTTIFTDQISGETDIDHSEEIRQFRREAWHRIGQIARSPAQRTPDHGQAE